MFARFMETTKTVAFATVVGMFLVLKAGLILFALALLLATVAPETSRDNPTAPVEMKLREEHVNEETATASITIINDSGEATGYYEVIMIMKTSRDTYYMIDTEGNVIETEPEERAIIIAEEGFNLG